jgi:DEAD/DEAH box helicase
VPIIDAVLRARAGNPGKRTFAIVVYPMNALANSHVGELDRYFKDVADPRRVTYKRYTGQESQEERRRIADNPPDILLTDFMMLELLLIRQDELDQRVIGHCESLEFLVLDELRRRRSVLWREAASIHLGRRPSARDDRTPRRPQGRPRRPSLPRSPTFGIEPTGHRMSSIFRRKAAAFRRWHEPDDARVSRPE